MPLAHESQCCYALPHAAFARSCCSKQIQHLMNLSILKLAVLHYSLGKSGCLIRLYTRTFCREHPCNGNRFLFQHRQIIYRNSSIVCRPVTIKAWWLRECAIYLFICVCDWINSHLHFIKPKKRNATGNEIINLNRNYLWHISK